MTERPSYPVESLSHALRIYFPEGTREIPWDVLQHLPASWVVISDGWEHSRHATERAAHDRANDLRMCGCAASVVASDKPV